MEGPVTYHDQGMHYCTACGRWRWLIAYWRCRECYDKWFNQREE